MTPGLHYISTAHSTVLSVSLHRGHQKTVIKDHNWEWAESGLLRGKLIYLYSVSAGLNTLVVFLLAQHFTQTPLLSFFLSNKHFCFSYTSLWLQIVFHLPWWDCAKDSSTCVKRCKENNSLWAFSALTFCQFWARQPGSKTCCRALLKGQFHRTIAHITPNPSDTQGDPWVTMTKSDRLWIMKANADAKSANWQ